MNKFFDLRFVIGIFFLAVGILLLIYSFTNPTIEHADCKPLVWDCLYGICIGNDWFGISEKSTG